VLLVKRRLQQGALGSKGKILVLESIFILRTLEQLMLRLALLFRILHIEVCRRIVLRGIEV
jgi:hypothetical protein